MLFYEKNGLKIGPKDWKKEVMLSGPICKVGDDFEDALKRIDLELIVNMCKEQSAKCLEAQPFSSYSEELKASRVQIESFLNLG